MVTNTRVIGGVVDVMDMVSIYGKMEINTREVGNKIRGMVGVFFNKSMGINMKVIGYLM